MKVIKLKEVSVTDTWNVSAYPGDGAYLTPNGIAFVAAGCVTVFNMGNWSALPVEADEPKASPSADLDVHRLVGQIHDIVRSVRQ